MKCRHVTPDKTAILYTTIAMIAFAGNSLICRLALRDNTIDPASFTAIRLIAGALTLLLISWLTRRSWQWRRHGNWASALLLFTYALGFSYAYSWLSAGVGALILFGFVQATMIIVGLCRGDRPSFGEWLGWVLAFAGLTWLLLPGEDAPSLPGSLLMATAGVAWGYYSIRGRAVTDALSATTVNFTYCLPMVAILVATTASSASISARGIFLAVASGAITSGIGYVIWYVALDYLRPMQAALVQLSVPAIAAAGGIVLLSESVSMAFVLSSTLVLGGIGLALTRRARG
ncbi:MAG: DMT family transporter [Woeseiaceae bacterium]